MTTIPHKTYDRVIGNDWEKYPYIQLFLNGTPAADVVVFVSWCAAVSQTRLRLQFEGAGSVFITKAGERY